MVSDCLRKGSLALGAALMALLLMPSLAFAGENAYTIQGNVTVSLQSSQAVPAASGASSAATALAKTGDAVLWLVLGIAAVGLCAALALRASRRAAVGASGSSELAPQSQKGFLAVMLACLLAAVLSFGQFAVNTAYAVEGLSGVTCNGQVVVDEKGKVVSSNLKIANGSAATVHVKSIQLPEELTGWSATAPETGIEANGECDVEWAAKDLSPELLQKLKSSNGELALQMTSSVAVATYTVSFDTCRTDCSVESQVVQEADTSVTPAEPVSDDYEFVGWYTDKDYTQAFDFSTPITSDLTLYAKWTVKGYWLAAADAQDPTANVVKSMSEVDADVAAIKNDDSATIAEYKKYLSDDSVHLYTRWNGSTVDASGESQAANKYVEFRILQVGNHDSEGCNITFQATHLLPEASVMNSDDVNAGGWGATELRASMQPGGAIYKNFDSSFTDKILTVSKASTKGDMSMDKVYSQDKFWILCYSELTGAGTSGLAGFEGSQYAYWAEKGITYESREKFPDLVLKTRADNYPANLDPAMYRWWERSPLLAENWPGSFVNVVSGGEVGHGAGASDSMGIALAFCF